MKRFVLAVVSWCMALFLTASPLLAFAQNLLFDIEHFTVDNGLPARSIYNIAQDRDGYMWFSSQIGIHRFDGNSYKTYSCESLNIPSRRVVRLALDTKNRLWYCGVNSAHRNTILGILDIDGDTLITVEEASEGAFSKDDIWKVAKAPYPKKGMIILTATGDLYHKEDSLGWLGNFNVHDIKDYQTLVPGDGEHWVMGHKKLLHLKEGQRDAAAFDFNLNYSSNWVLRPVNSELTVIQVSNQEVYPKVFSNGKFIPFSEQHPIFRDDSQPLYIDKSMALMGDQDSIYIYTSEGKLLTSFADPNDISAKSFTIIHEVFRDRQANVWIATEKGVTKISKQNNRFSTSFSGCSLYGIYKSSDKMWVTGLQYQQRGQGQSVRPQSPFPIQNGQTIIQDSKGVFWIGNRRSFLHRMKSNGEALPSYHLKNQSPRIVPFQNKVTENILYGTGNGIFRLKGPPENYQQIPIRHREKGLSESTKHFHQNETEIWVAGSYGLVQIDPQTETLKDVVDKEDGLPAEDINHIHEDAEGNFWLASLGGGLIYWDRERNHFQQFTTENGLSNNTLYAVYEDDFGTLWLPSDYGLMAFDKESHDVRTFHVENGIAHEEFNTFSHFQEEDGTLHFGGLNGLTSFHPRDFHTPPDGKESKILLSQIKTLENGGKYFNTLPTSGLVDGEIVLSPEIAALELSISFLDFKNTKRNQLAYRLSDYQEGWIYPERNTIVLRNLPYGPHDLLVRARGASGSWTQSPLIVRIRVLRPFYLKTWFIALLVALVVATIWGAVRLRLRALRKDQQRLTLEVEKRTATIKRQAEELREIDQIKSQFFANITHEFRTPLTLVIGPTEQLLEDNPPPRIRNRLYGILRNASNLLLLINQLLDISKLESRQMEVETRAIDVCGLTRRLAGHFEPLAVENDLRLALDIQNESCWVQIDPDKWQKIINNLLSNAIKFTPPGGSIHLTLQLESDGKTLFLQVRDTGIGLKETDRERIFDRFYQVNSSSTRVQGGTGIGLALVKDLVELLRGKIQVESALGKGTLFSIHVPVELAEAIEMEQVEEQGPPEIENATAADQGQAAEALGERLDLLLIEDNAELRAYIRSCIDERKYRISEAANGAEGLRMAFETVPDLVISDVMMPEMDGFQLTQALREHIATSHIPLILLTAKANEESRLEGLRRGADAYLTKPFSPAELNLRIDKLIEVRKALQERFRIPQTLQEAEAPVPAPSNNFEVEDRFISELKAFIDENLDDPELKLPKIIGHFGMSKTQFYRKLKTLTDVGISDMIRSARCDHALKLIRGGESSMKEVAYSSGFSSPSNFSRTFKQQFGISPTEVMPTEVFSPSDN